MGEKKIVFRNRFIRFSILCFFLTIATGGASVVLAQDDEFVLEEIVVTGSRIVRNNNDSASPIVTVDEKLFDQSATLALETQLNKLPQFTPTGDIPQIGGYDIQPTARNTPGEATVALRGIGANRTLVLINGRRGTPSNATGVLDINTIPTAAIEYVEAISGGASSTYGADAMAGVLNFIMKEHFEGFELDVQSGITQEGDGFEYQVSGIVGANFAEDRGNVSMAFSYNDRDTVQAKDRDWYKDMWADPSIGGTQFFPEYTGVFLGYSNVASLDVLNSVIENVYTSPFNAVYIYDDGNGNAFTGFNSQTVGGADSLIDNYNVKLQNNGYLGVNNVDSYLIYPLERYNMYSQGNYELNDWVTVFGQGYFSKTKAQSIQEPGPITSGWDVTIDPSINRGLIPSEILTILDSRPNPDGTVMILAMLPENREGFTDTTAFNMVSGLKGDIPKIDWTWEAFVSHGESETTSTMTGMYSLQRIREIMQQPNFGAGWSYTGNQDGVSPGFGAATATCTSGLNPFDWGSVSQDCLDAIKSDVKSKQLMTQTIWEFNAQGLIADLPMGEMRGAAGVSHRENEYEFRQDTMLTQGTSYLEQILGLYPAGDSEGSIDVMEYYAELLVPVLKDLPLVKQLNLELGGRSSDYNTTGISNTYKALFDWQSMGWLRFRGGYNRAERAPNIAELYLAPEMTFGYSAYGDVCSMRNTLSYSANPDNNSNWQEVVKLCGQLMEAAGADADVEYYGTDWRNIYNDGLNADDLDIDDQPAAGGSYLWPQTVGNPDLDTEKADTWTLGFVIDSSIVSADIPAFKNWRVSVDYYQIKVEDAIGEQSADLVMRMCTDPQFNPTLDPDSPYCAGFNRNASSGGIGLLNRTFYNNGRFETSGIDVQIDWGMDVGPGRLGVNSSLNYLLEMKSSELDVLPLIDYAGTYGATQNGLNSYFFEFKSLTSLTYAWDDIDLTIRWTHQSELDPSSSVTTGTVTTTGIDAYDMYDLLGNYQLTDNIRLRFGIENVFNIEPEYVGVTLADYVTNGMTGGSYSTGTQDVNGRRFYVGVRMYF